MKCYKFIVSGKVQGVSYQKSVKEIASLGQIQGYIKDLPNKKVEVVAYLWEDQVGDFETILNIVDPVSTGGTYTSYYGDIYLTSISVTETLHLCLRLRFSLSLTYTHTHTNTL